MTTGEGSTTPADLESDSTKTPGPWTRCWPVRTLRRSRRGSSRVSFPLIHPDLRAELLSTAHHEAGHVLPHLAHMIPFTGVSITVDDGGVSAGVWAGS